MDETKETVLTKQQVAVLDDIFEGDLREEGAVKKHEISSQLYRKWLNDDVFADEFEFRIATLQRQGRLMLAKLASFAAIKLADLMGSGKPEIVRKTCLDLTSFTTGIVDAKCGKSESPADTPGQFDQELAGRLLDMLAEGK